MALSTLPQPAALIPRRLLLAAGAAAAVTVVGVGALRSSGFRPASADAAAVAERRLRFVDRSDRGIDVVDAASGRTLEVLHGEQGFLRGTLRGLLRARKRAGGASDATLVLTARADGRLTLADPGTGERIDLESFGSTNAALFARWLTPHEVTP